MTHTEVARRAKVSLTHISKIYNGRRRPSLDVAKRIARAKGITIDALYAELARIRKAP